MEDQGRVSHEAAINFGKQVAQGLQYLHSEKNIVHRDLKPQNILLTADASPVLKITDFGLSRVMQATHFSTAHVAGTEIYMAPEQHAGERQLTEKCDIYAWGLILWELWTGRPPLVGAPGGDYPRLVVQEGRRPQLPVDMPQWLKALLTDCWARDPRDRPACGDILARLDRR